MERVIRSSLLVVVSAVAVAACGGHNAEAECIALRVNLCRKQVECGYQSGGSDYVRACETAAKRECVEVACRNEAKPIYDPVAAEACPDAIQALTCNEFDQLGAGLPSPCHDICHE